MEGQSFTVSASLVDPIISTVTENIGILLPAGLGITAIVIGARLVPKLFKSFVRG